MRVGAKLLYKRFIRDMKKYFSFSIISAKSQLKSEVANSYLNWLWWILTPTCFMLIYTFIFGYVKESSYDLISSIEANESNLSYENFANDYWQVCGHFHKTV